jgi:hypothetical protein
MALGLKGRWLHWRRQVVPAGQTDPKEKFRNAF